MKKIVSLSCALVCIFAAGAAHAQSLKIGTVDMTKIFNEYYKTKDAEVHINDARTEAKKALDDQMETYKETMDEIKRLNEELQDPGLSDSKRNDITKTREEKINEFKNLDQSIQEFRAQKEKELQTEALRRRDEIVADIMKLINAKIKSDNYDYVFDKSGMSLNGVPVLIFARESVDFSDEIIKSLNANRPKDTSTPAPASATPKPSDNLKP